MNRLPRPQGSTYLSLKFQQTNQEEDKQKLYLHLINIYALDGFRWNKCSVPVHKLSEILNIPVPDIMGFISDLGTNMGAITTPENIEKTLKSIITLSTTWAIQDRGLIADQLALLLNSQGPGYTPFISGEVNKALKLILDSNKNLMESYKTFFTSSNTTTNILNINNKGNNKDSDILTPEDALHIINHKQLPDTSKPALPQRASDLQEIADVLYQEYGGVGGFEDVRENRSGREALMAPKLKGHEAPEPVNITIRKPKRRKANLHEDSFERRNISVIDTDSLPDSE